MRKIAILFFCGIIVSSFVRSQSKYTIGVNAAELPALTLDVNHFYKISPRFELMGNTGFSFNHTYGGDINWILVPHYKCEGDYKIINQSGGFLKAGFRFNFRKLSGKNHYIFSQINIIGSMLFEKVYPLCTGTCPAIWYSGFQHWVFISGAGTTLGYSFQLGKKLFSDLGLQVSYPFYRDGTLYGFRNFIPGIGFKDSNSKWFPVIVFNINYPFGRKNKTSDF